MNNNCNIISKLFSDSKLIPKTILLNMTTYKHGDIFLNHIHEGAIELMYVSQGHIFMQVNNHYVKIDKNECLIIFPNTIHNLIPKKNEKCNAACFVFTPGELSGISSLDYSDSFSFLYKVLSEQSGYTKIICNYLIKNVIERIYNHNSEKTKYAADLTKLYFCELYIYLSEELNENIKKRIRSSNHFISVANEFIINNYANNISTQDIAKCVNLSARQISRLFKKELNMSIHQYITFLRIEKAKALLANKDKSITTIALALGFYSSQHFSTTFKKLEQISPNIYRKNLR